MIRTIHRFWAGRAIPEAYVDFGRAWEALNPDWKLQMWVEDDIYEFPELLDIFKDMYRRDDGRYGIELYVQIADVMGYAIIESHGGVYVNCDMQPVRPLVNIFEGPWASLENNEDGRIVNAAIGATQPHDPFWTGLLDGLPERYFSRPGAEMVEATGPAYLTDYARAHPDELHVYGTNVFNPVHWGQIESGGDASAFLDSLPDETIALHHWGHRKDRRTNIIEGATHA